VSVSLCLFLCSRRPVSCSLSFFVSCSGAHRDLHLSLHDALPISGRSASSSSHRERRTSGRSAAASFIRPSSSKRNLRVSRLGLRSEEHTSELQSLRHLVCRLLLEKKKKTQNYKTDKKKKRSTKPK